MSKFHIGQKVVFNADGHEHWGLYKDSSYWVEEYHPRTGNVKVVGLEHFWLPEKFSAAPEGGQWIVWSEYSYGPYPHDTYYTIEEAWEECQRLAGVYPNRVFHVCKLAGSAGTEVVLKTNPPEGL